MQSRLPKGNMPSGQPPRVNFAEMVQHLEEMDRQRLRQQGITEFMNNSVVHPNGMEITRLNLGMLHDRKITPENLAKIKAIHIQRYDMLEQCKKAPSKDLGLKWKELEIALQSAWGKEIDEKEFKFWAIPGCTCPKQENEHAYPNGAYITDPNCPLH